MVGLLATGISYMNGVGGYAGWRWIFIIIGLATTLAGIASIWLVQNFPDSAKCKPVLKTERRNGYR